MLIQFFEIDQKGGSLSSSNVFSSLEDFELFFKNFMQQKDWIGFFARYLKCFEHIYEKNDYSDKNILRLKLLFTGKNIFKNHVNNNCKDNEDDYELTEDDYDYTSVIMGDVYLDINDNYIYISEKDDEVKFYTLSNWLIIIQNHPMQIMYKKLTESNIDTSPTNKILYGRNCHVIRIN